MLFQRDTRGEDGSFSRILMTPGPNRRLDADGTVGSWWRGGLQSSVGRFPRPGLTRLDSSSDQAGAGGREENGRPLGHGMKSAFFVGEHTACSFTKGPLASINKCMGHLVRRRSSARIRHPHDKRGKDGPCPPVHTAGPIIPGTRLFARCAWRSCPRSVYHLQRERLDLRLPDLSPDPSTWCRITSHPLTSGP